MKYSELVKSIMVKSMDLNALKKLVINHLKKQEKEEQKKELSKALAVDEIMQKANFPVGTIREWKGKKYKKIAPGKWARMYDTKGRGTNIAVGKLIARVNKIDNVEDLMKFCLEHKQRFADTDILEKIRAAVDAQNEKLSGKEGSSKTEETPKKEKNISLKDLGFEEMESVKYNGDYWKVAGYGSKGEGISLTPDRSKGNLLSSNKFVLKDDFSKIERTKEPAKEAEEKKIAKKGYFATDKQIDYVSEVADKRTLSREKMLKKPVSRIQQFANSKVEDFAGSIDKFIEYMAEMQDGISLDEIGKEWARLVNHNVARKIFEEYNNKNLVINEDGYFVENKESEAEKHQNRSEAMKGNKNAYKEKIKEIIQKLKNAKSYEESDLRKEKLQVEKDFLKNDKKGFDEYAKEQAEKKFNNLNFSKYSKEQLTDYINNTIKYNMDIMQRHIDNGNYESGMDKSDYEHAREMLKNEKYVFEDKLKEVSTKEGSSKKEELPKSNVEMTPKQQKIFDEFEKKYIKKDWPKDRIEKFSKHNYDINGEDWTITTDGRIMLCVKEKFDEPENANKIAVMRGVFDILNPKEIETPKDIDTLIKNAPKKVVVGKDYKGKDEKQNAIVKIGDRYFSVEHLKTIQDFLGPLSNVKIEADPRETKVAKFISGDKAVVAMPFSVDDENDKRIIKASSLKKSISYRVDEIFRGL